MYDYDTIIRSMNARSNLMGRIMDDPMPGVIITPEMMIWAQTGGKSGNTQSRRVLPDQGETK